MNTSHKRVLTRELIHAALWKLAARRAEKDPKDLVPGLRLMQDLGADSLDMAELAMELEEELDITIPDKVLEKPDLTLGDIEEALSARCLDEPRLDA